MSLNVIRALRRFTLADWNMLECPSKCNEVRIGIWKSQLNYVELQLALLSAKTRVQYQ